MVKTLILLIKSLLIISIVIIFLIIEYGEYLTLKIKEGKLFYLLNLLESLNDIYIVLATLMFLVAIVKAVIDKRKESKDNEIEKEKK